MYLVTAYIIGSRSPAAKWSFRIEIEAERHIAAIQRDGFHAISTRNRKATFWPPHRIAD